MKMKQSIKPQGFLPCVKDGEKDEDEAEHQTTRTSSMCEGL